MKYIDEDSIKKRENQEKYKFIHFKRNDMEQVIIENKIILYSNLK